MPELPEVETARSLIAEQALNRMITVVDDADTYVTRPHLPGQLRDALVGRALTAVRRRGESIWVEASGVKGGPAPGGAATEGGGPRRRDAQPRKPEWDRFTLEFADGGRLALFDKRRLGRVRLNPDINALGPDAGEVTEDQFLQIGRASCRARV